MTAREVLDTIAARADAATEGPWHVKPNDLIGGVCVMPIDATPGDSNIPEVADFVMPINAEFIAAARRDVPAMVAALRAVLEHPRREVAPDMSIAQIVSVAAYNQALRDVWGAVESVLDPS